MNGRIQRTAPYHVSQLIINEILYSISAVKSLGIHYLSPSVLRSPDLGIGAPEKDWHSPGTVSGQLLGCVESR